MVMTRLQLGRPLHLAVTGEAESWLPALEQIVGPQYLTALKVRDDAELLRVVQGRQVDAAVLDDAVDWQVDALRLLRMIRRLDDLFPVVVVTARRDRLYMESALRLAAFSVVVRPLALEELLRQIQRMMRRLDEALRNDSAE
jgi:DNA-binding response OmpR family regulator